MVKQPFIKKPFILLNSPSIALFYCGKIAFQRVITKGVNESVIRVKHSVPFKVLLKVLRMTAVAPLNCIEGNASKVVCERRTVPGEALLGGGCFIYMDHLIFLSLSTTFLFGFLFFKTGVL